VAALNRIEQRAPLAAAVPATITDALDVTLAAPAACPRYAGRVIHGVDIGKPSPLWLRERLRRAGVRSIDAVVDVTNYVLLELVSRCTPSICASLAATSRCAWRTRARSWRCWTAASVNCVPTCS